MNKNFSEKRMGAALHVAVVMAAVLLTLSMMLTQSFAQDVSPGNARKGLQILMLGTHGGPGLVKQRSEPATLLIVDGQPYLIDCGIGTMQRMLDAGVQSQTVGTIFFTHDHPDHALGLVDVLANDYLLSYDFARPSSHNEFNIYGPPQTPALVKAAYQFIKIPYGIFAAEPLGRSKLIDPFKVHVVDHDGLVYHDDKIRVTAAENTHYRLMPAKYHATMKSYSYRFDTPYGSIVFTGDTGQCQAVEALAKGADVLISEVEDLKPIERSLPPSGKAGKENKLAGHMRLEHLPMKAVGELATAARVKAVILYHFVGVGNGEKFVTGVKKYYSGPVFAGEDLARYCLSADTANNKGASKLTLCN